MKEKKLISQIARSICAAIMCVALIIPANSLVLAKGPAPDTQAAASIPPDQLDALVAPIALYPDNLLAQVMVASTYPLEVIQLHQWLLKNKDIKDQKKLAEKVAKQPWDPSIQAMAPLPDVVKWLADDIQWTTDLGNAFLAQQKDVMAAVQRMRQKAQAKGTLATSDQQKVETQVVESQSVIVIQQANPQVVYVPSYDPIYAYGPPVYPYPPIYYPPYYGTGAVAAGFIGFGVGVAIGAAWGGGWGWGCGWGGGDVNVNINNNFNRNTNIQGGNRTNIQGGNRVNTGGSGKWNHDPNHRGGAPYGDKGTANKFGGTTRGDSLSNRQNSAQRQLGQQGGKLSSSDRAGDRSNTGGNRAGDRSNTSGNRAGDRSNTGGNRAGDRSSTGGNRAGDRNSSSGRSSDKIGNRSTSGSSSNRGMGSGSSGGFGGSSTRSSSSRGSSSMGGSRGGSMGGSRGGGGGSRGGGGGRRR